MNIVVCNDFCMYLRVCINWDPTSEIISHPTSEISSYPTSETKNTRGVYPFDGNLIKKESPITADNPHKINNAEAKWS